MSLQISDLNQLDPFAKKFEECSKPGCGGKLGLRVESKPGGGQRTQQICRRCGHTVTTSEVNVIRGR